MRYIFGAFMLLMALSLISYTEGYCAIKNRELHANISKGIIKGSEWLMEEQGKDGKWLDLHTTGNVITTLRMIGHDLDETKSCAKPFFKGYQYFKQSKSIIAQMYGGRLAYVILGLNSLCQDPGNFMGLNLTAKLLKDMGEFPKGRFNHYFQYSLAMIALGVNGVKVPWSVPKKVVDKVKHILRTKEKHTKDTCAMMAMGLTSVHEQFKHDNSSLSQIKWTMTKLVTTLGMKTDIVKDNLYTKSLVMQAHSATDRILPWELEKCEKLYTALLSNMKSDGSFGSLSANLHVLPALVGRSYLDLKNDALCTSEEKGKMGKKYINVCVKVEFEGNSTANPPAQTVSILEGSTAFQAIKTASLKHPCYSIITTKTSWGLSVRSICRKKINHFTKQYWMLYVDGKQASTGVGRYIPKANECITMKYETLVFKK